MGVYIDSQDKSVFPFFEYDCVTSPCCVIESCRTCFHSTGAPSLALPWRLPLQMEPDAEGDWAEPEEMTEELHAEKTHIIGSTQEVSNNLHVF